jgi:hypothetical protein
MNTHRAATARGLEASAIPVTPVRAQWPMMVNV